MTITIAPIVGYKEVILCHRDDGRLLYECQAPVLSVPDFDSFPLAAFVRSWKGTLEPGDVLVMPAGTYHAARNLTKCLSYSRLHVDKYDLLWFLTSWLNEDAPRMEHTLILWNAASALIEQLDDMTARKQQALASTASACSLSYLSEEKICSEAPIHTENPSTGNSDVHTAVIERDALECLTLLRHSARAVVQISQSRNFSAGVRVKNSAEWTHLIQDIDNSVKRFLDARKVKIPYDPVAQDSYMERTDQDVLCSVLSGYDEVGKLQRNKKFKTSPGSTPLEDVDEDDDDDMDGPPSPQSCLHSPHAKLAARMLKGNNSSSSNKSSSEEDLVEDKSHVIVLSGSTSISEGLTVWPGRRVSVRTTVGKRKRVRKGQVTGWLEVAEVCMVHYEGADVFSDELV